MMYDHIKLSIPVEFSGEGELLEFTAKYGMTEVDNSHQTWNNANNKGLPQYKSVYVKLKLSGKDKRDFKDNKKYRQSDTMRVSAQSDEVIRGLQKPACVGGTLTLSFSLHKFYNYCMKGEPFNWDDFSFAQANRAKGMLVEMFPMLDFGQARVITYEVGCNVECPTAPENIMQQLEKIVIKKREYPIVNDRNFTQYKLFGTYKRSDKSKMRIVYMWYDKTHEVREKHKKDKMYYAVRENIMRVEKDNKILIDKTMFFDLFKKEFQTLTKNEFRKRVVDDVFFAERVPSAVPTLLEQKAKNKEQRQALGLTPSEYGFFVEILEKGTEGTTGKLDREYQQGKVPRNTYFRHKREIKRVSERLPELKRKMQAGEVVFWEEEYKNLINKKIEIL